MTHEQDTGHEMSIEIAGFVHMPETGDYEADCRTGHQFADALISRMAATEFTPMLGIIVREMVASGRWTAAHVGLFERLANRFLVAAG